jgi:hypothetical protein
LKLVRIINSIVFQVRHLRDRPVGRQHVGQVVDGPDGQPVDIGGSSLGLSKQKENRFRSGHEHQDVGTPGDGAAGLHFVIDRSIDMVRSVSIRKAKSINVRLLVTMNKYDD